MNIPSVFTLRTIAIICLSVTLQINWASEVCAQKPPVTIGISWRTDTTSEFYTNIVKVIKEAGGTPLLLPQVVSNRIPHVNGTVNHECIDSCDYLKSTYAETLKQKPLWGSNAEEAMKGIDGVVFTGGEDISPTLYANPQPWHGIAEDKDYNATRDVNDYILMSYCIDKDITTIGFCRGMQMIGVVSGAEVIQDIPAYFAAKGLPYNYIHRNEKMGDGYRDYSPHDVTVAIGSHLYTMSDSVTILHNVPSWHHQALKSVEGTQLSVTGFTETNGEQFIEAIERKDKSFIVGLQFHPEASILKVNAGAANAGNFMSKEKALAIFKNFIAKVRERKENHVCTCSDPSRSAMVRVTLGIQE